MVSKLLIVSLIVCTANAAVWIGLVPPKPKEFADKEGCYIREINNVIPFGSEIRPLGHCVRINCDTEMVDYASCGVVYTSDRNCHITEQDLSKPYPDCCQDIKCDSENDINVES